MMASIILVVKYVLFGFGGYARGTLLDVSKALVDDNGRFSTSILCTKK